MNALKFFLLVSLVLFSLFQTSCHRKRTENPKEVYRLWAGEEVPSNIKVLKGKYWQSAHFTKEYIVYMELVAPREWMQHFIEQNKLKIENQDREIPADAPEWFKPPTDHIVWTPSGFSQGSRYFIDTAYSHMLLYEIQL